MSTEMHINPLKQCLAHNRGIANANYCNEKKIQLGKFSEAFTLPQPKTLPIVLLNLRSPFGKNSLSLH